MLKMALIELPILDPVVRFYVFGAATCFAGFVFGWLLRDKQGENRL